MPRPRDDLRLAASWPRHPKTLRLERALGAAGPLCLLRLWCWAVADGRLDGDLAGVADGDLELAAGWDGPDGELVGALSRFGWLDGDSGERRLHDWAEEQPWLTSREERREAARESGRLGGQRRAERMTPEERSEAAKKAAEARHECVADAKACVPDPTHDAKGLRRDAYLSGSGSGSGTDQDQEENQETKRRAGAREGAPAPGPEGPPPRRRAKREGGGTPGWVKTAIDTGAHLPPETFPAWRRWIEHLRARKKPTPGALQKHLADIARVIAAKGPQAAAKLLDESIGANAQGLQPWAVEQAIAGTRANGRTVNGLRPSILERVESGEIAVEGYTPGDGPIEFLDLAALQRQNRAELPAAPTIPETQPDDVERFPWH